MNRRIVRVVRGVTALALLATLLVGLPIALVTMVGWPLPTQVPTWDQFERVLTTGEVDSWTIVKALAVLVWIAWGQLTASAVAEIVALSRGRRPSRTPSIKPLRIAAAQLVTTAALIFSSVGRVAADAPTELPDLHVALAEPAPVALGPPTDADASQPREVVPIDLTSGEETAKQSGPPADRETAVWHVRPRDTLWGIAESTLDDGMRWREIHDLNVGRRQPDGGSLRPGDDLIRPGWILHLPADASSSEDIASSILPQPTHVEEPLPATITVERNDTLWELAGTHLGDPHRWPELFEANRDRAQPDGRRLTDPDLIDPGWQLEVPAVTGTDLSPAPTSDPDDEAPASSRSTEDALPPSADLIPWAQLDPGTAPIPGPASRPQAPGQAHRSPDLEEPILDDGLAASESITDTDLDDETQGGDEAWTERSVRLAGAGLVAAGIIATLDGLRRARRRRRAPGQRIRLPDGELATAEQRVRGLADAATAELLDLTLRSLAASCAREDRPVPAIALVSVGVDDLAIHLATSDPSAPEGWRCEDDGMTWVTTRPPDVQQLRELAATALSPTPLLVTIGTTAATRRRVLLNLAHARSLAIQADPETTRTLLLGQALELATTTRADALQVVLAEADDQLSSLERIRSMTPTEAIALLERRATGDCPDGAGRPATAFLFLSPPPAELVRAGATLADSDNHNLALVCPQLPDAAWRITTDGPSVVVAPYGVELEPLELMSDDLAAIERLLIDTARPSYTSPQDQNPQCQLDILMSPNGDAPATANALAPTDPDGSSLEVRVLGPVEVAGAGDFASAKAEELIVYLAMHRNGAGADTLQEALWPGATPSTGRLHTTVYRARNALGDNDELRLIPRAKQGRYRISPEVGLDYERFTAHVARAASDPEDAIRELRSALELVRGRPLSCTSGEYAWATYDTHAIEQHVSDAAHQLAQLALEDSQPEEARWAAERGLIADPYCEILYRDLMLTAAQVGNTTEVHAIMQRLRQLLADEPNTNDTDDYLDPATVDLFENLTRGPSFGRTPWTSGTTPK